MRPQRAPAAREREPRGALEPLGTNDSDHTDHSGSGHMGAAARRDVEPCHLDQSEQAGTRRLLAERQAAGFFLGGETGWRPRVVPHDLVAAASASAISRALTSRARSIVDASLPSEN